MANLFCNVLVKFGEGAVEAEQGAIRELAWKKSHATQQYQALFSKVFLILISLG